MTTCKVEFSDTTDQKIILNFVVEDSGEVSYNVKLDPQIKDPKTILGFKGGLCQILIDAIENIGANNNKGKEDNGEDYPQCDKPNKRVKN